MFPGVRGPSAAPSGMGADAGVRSFVRQLSFLPAAPQRPMALNGLATALVPAATLAVGVLLRRHVTSTEPAGTPARERVLLATVLAAVLGGCVAAHPSAVFATAVALPPLRGSRPAAARGAGRRRPWPAVAAAGAVAAAAVAVTAALAILAPHRGDGLQAGGAGRSPGFTASGVLRPSDNFLRPFPRRPLTISTSRLGCW